jgi:predicted histidine transporter YuiF (NhaC family)
MQYVLIVLIATVIVGYLASLAIKAYNKNKEYNVIYMQEQSERRKSKETREDF